MKTLDWADLGVVVQFEEGGAYIDFKVFDVVAHGQDAKGDFTVKLYEQKGATSSEETTENLDEAQTLLRGSIKWDCCSHVYFGDENGYIHMCGARNWRDLPQIMSRLFAEAKEILVEPHSADMWE